MKEEPIAKVELTLAESGTLCHLLLASIIEQKKHTGEQDGMIFTPDVKKAMLANDEKLWRKLAAANDSLMRKQA